jgi:glycosyltransferase involved in cell wall biosynthesis
MNEPRLTIGIPHLDRSEHLQWAIDSCLQQTLPVRVIVADQGHTDRTAKVMRRYDDHPHVMLLPTEATCLWENWRAAAEACETEFFAWLQDDDIISRVYASRVVKAFDYFPAALHWEARCYVSPDRKHAVWWGVNGPQVGLDMIDLAPEMWPGEMILASLYLLSWALSPGVAFRCGPEFAAALEIMPSHCDLFSERLIVGEMALRGPWIADPVTAGYWHHHGANESYRQNADGSFDRQQQVMFDHLDDLLDRCEDWRDAFALWLRSRNPGDTLSWLANWPAKASRYSDALQAVMRESLDGRVEPAPAPARAGREPVILYD